MAECTREEAERTVRAIAQDYGHLDEDMMNDIEGFNEGYRRRIEEAFLAKDKLAGGSMTALAKNVYGSDARFFFELLQNADDNRYTRVGSSSPTFSFTVYKDRIVIENNEDGFTRQNVMALCAIDRSTKSGAEGYIGAKGIGFKSVFIMAEQVDVQSGNFTFCFKSPKSGTGMGMVVPIWQPNAEVLSGPLTRITLHLHGNNDPPLRQHLRNLILNQLEDLQETCLLFLRNIKIIKLKVLGEHGEVIVNKTLGAIQYTAHLHVLEVVDFLRPSDHQTSTKKYYHVTEHIATGVPKSDNRDMGSSNTETSTKIILAFPTSADLSPIIENQSISAFLPVRESGFKFLIQSDFDTNASRQDILTTSLRNTYLRDQVAPAFVKAVLQFCTVSELRYTWPNYLPEFTDHLGWFWAPVRSQLQSMIAATPCLRSRHKEQLREPHDIRQVGKNARDEHGNPLFDDEMVDPFISGHYPAIALQRLMPYGLRTMNVQLFLSLLKRDLLSDTSKMRNVSTSEQWHTAVATSLEKHFDTVKPQLIELQMLPLRDGQWVSAQQTVFFPRTEQLSIPDQVNLLVLDEKATSNPSRQSLFVKLGVRVAEISLVRSSILALYSSFWFQCRSVEVSKEHLTYLYLTSPALGQERGGLERLVAFPRDGATTLPTYQLFLPTTDTLSAESLLISPDGAFTFGASFLHPAYLETPPVKSAGPTWTVWLVNTLKMRNRLTMIANDGTSLSDEWKFVYRHHPTKALHLLKSLWRFEGRTISASRSLLTQIKSLRVNELCATDIVEEVPLESAWLPLPELVRQVTRYMGSASHFPFLDIQIGHTDWTFLSNEFGVKSQDDYIFLLDVIYWIRKSRQDTDTGSLFGTMVDIYIALEARMRSFADTSRAEESISEFFNDNSGVLALDREYNAFRWCGLRMCVWKGPDSMISVIPLERTFRVRTNVEDMGILKNLFQRRLDVQDASYEDIVEELRYRRGNYEYEEGSFDDVLDIYRYLAAMNLSDADKTELRESFRSEELIYQQIEGIEQWYKSEECIWAAAAEIPGKVTLNDHYEELETLFVDIIGVERLTIENLYGHLSNPVLGSSVEEIKSMIWSFNAFLLAERTFYKDPTPIRSARIFPIVHPGGNVELVSAEVTFAIVDRDNLAILFRDKVKLLDFNLEEVRRLRPFIEWTNMGNCYISSQVRFITSVGEGGERVITRGDRTLKHKAYALLRIAATFESPLYRRDPRGLYDLLRNMETVETNGITSHLEINQDGETIPAPGPTASLDIQVRGQSMTVYVPRNQKEQEICFGSLLPRHFADWLMREPNTQISDGVDKDMVLVLSALFAYHASVVDSVLESHGIIQVLIENLDEPTDDFQEDSGSEEAAQQEDTQESSVQEGVTQGHVDQDDTSEEDPVEEHDGASNHHEEDQNEDSDDGNESDGGYTVEEESDGEPSAQVQGSIPVDRTEATGIVSAVSRFARSPGVSAGSSIRPFRLGTSTTVDPGYSNLLQRVTAAARRSGFPERGTFNMRALRESLQLLSSNYISYDGIDTFQGVSNFERNFKVGAAGELYVFEVFSHVGLRGWSQDNWQSRIRHLVSAHPDYVDIAAWHGHEQADLMYDDVYGDMTAILIEHGHLPQTSEWTQARPRYFLEVKTTTGPDHTQFFVSKNQYRLMQAAHSRDGLPTDDVYIVLRVFDLEDQTIGMSVYIDPEQLRVDNRLEFSADRWVVTPGAASGT